MSKQETTPTFDVSVLREQIKAVVEADAYCDDYGDVYIKEVDFQKITDGILALITNRESLPKAAPTVDEVKEKIRTEVIARYGFDPSDRLSVLKADMIDFRTGRGFAEGAEWGWTKAVTLTTEGNSDER